MADRTALTLYEIRRQRGTRQFTEICTGKVEEARAAEEAGIDIIVCPGDATEAIRKAAPSVFLITAPSGSVSLSNDEAVRIGLEAMSTGANAMYCGTKSLKRVEAMADVGIPVIGHVGFVPYRTNWIGGPRAVGKKADEAYEVYQAVKDYENAGAVGVEMEVVPVRVAQAITERTSLLTLSLGSGPYCDAQFLFAEDILGTHDGHYPRHAKKYRDLKKEYDRLRDEMVVAFGEYIEEVRSGTFPATEHLIHTQDAEVEAFLEMLDR